MTNLNTAKRTLCAARLKLDTAVGALERARELATTKQSEVARLEGHERSWIERHARKLADWVAAGSKGIAPVLAADAKAQATLASARAAAAAAAQALTSFEAAEQAAHHAVLEAERAVDAAALVVVGDEADARAANIERRRTELEQDMLYLRGVMGLSGYIPSAAVIAALHDDLHTPVNLIRERDDLNTTVAELSGRVNRAAEATAEWLARLEQLKADDGDDGAESVAA